MTEKALKELLQLFSQKYEPVKPFEIRSYQVGTGYALFPRCQDEEGGHEQPELLDQLLHRTAR